jgi:hypothetical protein
MGGDRARGGKQERKHLAQLPMSEKERHKVNATDGAKSGVVSLLNAATACAKQLPESKRYDVTIEITETDE